MPEYIFQQRINTIANIWEPFEFKDFRFEPLKIDFAHGTQKGWIASKLIVQDDVDSAYEAFFRELYPLVDRISFVAQCFAVVAFESFLIRRPDRTEFFLQFSRDRGHVSLNFGKDQLASLEALEDYSERGDPFRYLRQAINSPDFYARLAMLASALEGIAGEIKSQKTNHDYIRDKILKDCDLHKEIFSGNNGIRNQLLHGKKINDKAHGNIPYIDIVYSKIVDYFNNNHGTSINTNVKNAPRTIGLNYDIWNGWLTASDNGGNVDASLEKFIGLDIHEATKYFETIPRPNDY